MITRTESRKPSRGFTLIELLVVVAIIALLISILLPSLDRARRQSRQVVCGANQRSQGEASMLYAADNMDYIVCGMMGISDSRLYPGYMSYATSIMPYLGFKGHKNVLLRPNQVYDIPENVHNLWRASRGDINDSVFSNEVCWRARAYSYSQMEMLNCTDYPVFETRRAIHWDPDNDPISPSAMPLDFVSNAAPIRYASKNYNYDQGKMTFEFFAPPEGVDVGSTDYIERRRLEDFEPGISPSNYIYVTASHSDLDSKGPQRAFVFHHFFAGAQLPYASEPRIAAKAHHPAGLNAMFFDGHVEAVDLHEIDPACDASDFSCYSKRMSKITYVPTEEELTSGG